MPPKPSINGYSLFVKMRGIDLLEKEMGRRVNVGEAYDKCSQYWQEMNAFDKEEWKQRAIEYRQTPEWQQEREEQRERQLAKRAQEGPKTTTKKAGKDRDKKKTQLQLESEEKEVLKFYEEDDFEAWEKKRAYDRTFICNSLAWNLPTSASESKEALMKHKFIMMSVVPYYIDKTTKKVAPAEIAVVEFSLAEGIAPENTRVWRLAIEDFPNQESYEQALERSEDKDQGHGIPINQEREEVRRRWGISEDWPRVLKSIVKRIMDEKRVFVVDQNFNAVVGALDFLNHKSIEETGRSYLKQISPERFASIEDLVHALYQLGKVVPNSNEIAGRCSIDAWIQFGTNSQTICKHHHSEQRSSCALGNAKKPLYGLFEMLENVYPIDDATGPNYVPHDGDVIGNVCIPVEDDDQDFTDYSPGPREDLCLKDHLPSDLKRKTTEKQAPLNVTASKSFGGGAMAAAASFQYEKDIDFDDDDLDSELDRDQLEMAQSGSGTNTTNVPTFTDPFEDLPPPVGPVGRGQGASRGNNTYPAKPGFGRQPMSATQRDQAPASERQNVDELQSSRSSNLRLNNQNPNGVDFTHGQPPEETRRESPTARPESYLSMNSDENYRSPSKGRGRGKKLSENQSRIPNSTIGSRPISEGRDSQLLPNVPSSTTSLSDLAKPASSFPSSSNQKPGAPSKLPPSIMKKLREKVKEEKQTIGSNGIAPSPSVLSSWASVASSSRQDACTSDPSRRGFGRGTAI